MGRTVNPALFSGTPPQENTNMGNNTTKSADLKDTKDTKAPDSPDANAGDTAETKTPGDIAETKTPGEAAAAALKASSDTLGPQPTNTAGDNTLSAVEQTHGVKVGEAAIVFNPQIRPMRDPVTGDKFPVGVHKRVKELGVWTATQIGAGILNVGDESKLGDEPVKAVEDFDGPGSADYAPIKTAIDTNTRK